MSRVLRAALAIGVIGLAVACDNPAHPTRNTIVTGYVLFSSGAPAVGAAVTGSVAGVIHTATTDSTGQFVLGDYSVSDGQTIAITATLGEYPPASLNAQPQSPTTNVAVTLAPLTDQPASVALSLDSFTMGAAGDLMYFPDLVLRETTGSGAARIMSIDFTVTDGVSAKLLSRATSCLRSTLVSAGQTWRMDAPTNSDYYCQEIDTNEALKALFVTIQFVDPQGRLGTVTGTTNK